MAVVKDAEPRVVDLLLASGVAMTTWTVPAEIRERPIDGPALTHDDLLDFHHELSQDGWFERLLESAGDATPDAGSEPGF